MEQINKNKYLIIFCIILIGISVFLLYNNQKEDKEFIFERGEDISLKHYQENEYIPVSISYDQMARIYLQDYVYKLIYNREDAYNTLDSDYRSAKFASFDEFNKYINSIMSVEFREMKVSKFAIKDQGNYKYYDIYDSSDNLFIIKETGVMQYTVFFDRYTVEM